MKQITKLMTIGANCIAASFTNPTGLRVEGPVDNMGSFYIHLAPAVFDGKLKNLFFKTEYKEVDSTEKDKQVYHYLDKIYIFKPGYLIVHNDFSSKSFRKSLKARIKDFYNYCKLAQKNDTYWFIYSLNYEDAHLTEFDLRLIYQSIPVYCRERLLCLGIRIKNTNFEKVFHYYIEWKNELEFKWNNIDQAKELIDLFEQKYDLKFLPSETIK